MASLNQLRMLGRSTEINSLEVLNLIMARYSYEDLLHSNQHVLLFYSFLPQPPPPVDGLTQSGNQFAIKRGVLPYNAQFVHPSHTSCTEIKKPFRLSFGTNIVDNKVNTKNAESRLQRAI